MPAERLGVLLGDVVGLADVRGHGEVHYGVDDVLGNVIAVATVAILANSALPHHVRSLFPHFVNEVLVECTAVKS